MNTCRHAETDHDLVNNRDRIAERVARRQIERDGGGNEQAMIDGERDVTASKWITAASGTAVSELVLTAEPVDAMPLPVLPMELSA
jgi:hypothetical protein